MATALRALIKWYQTGETADRVAYDIAWVQDKNSPVDTINGFVEVYMDPRGHKGSWEALVFYVDPVKTEGIRKLAADAQWFEDRMPWAPQYRKQGVQGITANAIDVVIETGDSGPITPVGINLPNDQVIRETHGSKSVSLSNVNEAYDRSMAASFRREFAWTEEEAARAEKWSSTAGELTTNMHEVIGHASGKISEKLNGSPQSALKEQVLGARGIPRGSRGAVLSAQPAPRGARDRRRQGSGRDRPGGVPRATRETGSCNCGASVRERRSRKTTCAIGR